MASESCQLATSIRAILEVGIDKKLWKSPCVSGNRDRYGGNDGLTREGSLQEE